MIPLRLVFFCLSERERTVLSSEDLVKAMRMSVTWPGGTLALDLVC